MIEASPKENIFLLWLRWHYSYAVRGIVLAWQNYLIFNLQYFSFARLFKTLLSPWKKDKESYGRGFDIKVWARALLLNIFSRVLGALVRIVLILVGFVAEIFIFIFGILFLIFWIFLPFIVIAGIYAGIMLLI